MEVITNSVDKLPLEEILQLVYQSTPRLRFCELFTDDSGLWNDSSHSHPYLELVYYINGKCKVKLPGDTTVFSLCESILHPAHRKHQDVVSPEQKKEVLCLWIEIPELVFEKSIYLHDHNNQLRHAFEQVYHEARQEHPEHQYLEYAIKILLFTILRLREQAATGEQILDQTMEYLKDHFAQRITLEELAEMEHISTSYLSRKFKQRTGVTVVTYINRLRVEKAQQLLMASSLDINEIAYQTGFESSKYFYRVFKSVTGESPANFRRKYKRSAKSY